MPAVSLTSAFHGSAPVHPIVGTPATAFGSGLSGVANGPAFIALARKVESEHGRTNASSGVPNEARETQLRRYAAEQLSIWPPTDLDWIHFVTEGLVVKPGESVGATETQVQPPPIDRSANESTTRRRRRGSAAQQMGLSAESASQGARQKRELRHSGGPRKAGPAGGIGLERLDCKSDLVSSRPASGGSNPAAIVEVRESDGSISTYRVKDSRVPDWWLRGFEPELADSIDLRSDFYPAMEVTMAQVFKASGLDAPLMHLGAGCDSVIRPNATEGSSNDLYAMSKFDHNYVNLGKFLVSENARSQILGQFRPGTEQRREVQSQYQKILDKYHSACERQKSILAGRRYYEINGYDSASINLYRKLDRERFHALEQLNQMLPDDLLREQEQHYLMSRFVGNWDHLNFRMDNFGYTRSSDGVHGKTIDFDVTGPLGYMGVPKSEGHRIANVQRPPALFKLKHTSEEYDDFSLEHDPDLIGLDEQPYGEQSMTSIQRVLEAVERAKFFEDTKHHLARDPRFDSVLEFGYRLTKFSDNVLKTLVLNNWEDGPREFGLNPERLCDILKMRRDSMLSQIGLEWIENWRAESPVHAERVDRQVERAMSELGIR